MSAGVLIAGAGALAVAAPSLARKATAPGAVPSGVVVYGLAGPEWVPPGGAQRVVTTDALRASITQGFNLAQSAARDPRPDGVSRGYADSLQACNAWSARMFAPESQAAGAAALGNTVVGTLISNGVDALARGACDVVTPLLAGALVAGPAGVTLQFPGAVTGKGRPTKEGALTLAATWASSSPEQALLATASYAAQAVGAIAGWACRMGLAYGLDVLENVMRELGGAAMRPLLDLYRSIGAQRAVTAVAAVTRKAFGDVARAAGGVLGPVADALHLAAAASFVTSVGNGLVVKPARRVAGALEDAWDYVF